MRYVRYGLWAVLGLGFAGCGGGGKAKSFASITADIAAPSGTVNETTAVDVAEEFEGAASSASAAPFGRRDLFAGASASGSISCPAGGSISYSARGNGESGTAGYNDCCVEEGCCVDGSARVFISQDSTSYSACYDANVSVSCEGQSGNFQYSGCINESGQIVLVIEVDGETFAVSGSYAGGSGSLEITGANGTFTCTYSDGAGSCTGSGGESFSF